MGNAIASAALMKPSTVIKRVAETKVRPFLSTSGAAQMLGLSTTMVQTLVDQGDLKGWKTRGGHRRIARESVHGYQNISDLAIGAQAQPWVKPSVMVVVESEHLRQQLTGITLEWSRAVDVVFFDSITEAFLEMASKRPQMLLLEMCAPSAQQKKTLQALENFNAKGSMPLAVAVVTEHKDRLLSLTGSGLSSIQVVPGPLSALWIHAYLTGVMALSLTSEDRGRSMDNSSFPSARALL
jgi:excisionase family DNA binding protein